MRSPPVVPQLLMADEAGRAFEHPRLLMAGASARARRLPLPAEVVPLPPGADLFIMPGRHPVGFDPRTRQAVTVTSFDGKPVFAVAAFLPPAWTALLWAPFEKAPGAPLLPLYAYAAAGWGGGKIVSCAERVDPDRRQDPLGYPEGEAERRAGEMERAHPRNRLVSHLVGCCVTYRCPAARNYFLGRWEAPLPTSPACNARCLGCLSLQGEDGPPSTQQRIRFVPTPEEVAEVAVPHLENAPRPVVSFGQGCEGEPLLQGELLEASIRLIRSRTGRGTVNLNTNGSRPHVLSRLFDAGLDSVRVSLNSAREGMYLRYFKPVDYTFAEVVESLSLPARRGKWASVNYFVFPGVTDDAEEAEAFLSLLGRTRLAMIQWRNLNIDPEWYMDAMGIDGVTGRRGDGERNQTLGVSNLLKRVRREHPAVRFGYFNPCLEEEPTGGKTL